MTELSALGLPIVLSAIFAFVASSIIHMASPWHKSDYPKIPNEENFETLCARWPSRPETTSDSKAVEPSRRALP